MALLMPRAVAVAVGIGVAVSACGTSVADSDAARAPVTTRAAPPSPFCVAARHQSDALRPLTTLAQGGDVPADRVDAAVDAVRRSDAELVITAPPELSGDVQRYVEALNVQLDALVRARGDARSVTADPSVTAASGSPAAAAAAQRVTAYILRSCPRSGRPAQGS